MATHGPGSKRSLTSLQETHGWSRRALPISSQRVGIDLMPLTYLMPLTMLSAMQAFLHILTTCTQHADNHRAGLTTHQG